MAVPDEFSMLADNAAEYGLPYDSAPTVRRAAVRARSGLELSAIVWGVGEPEVVLVHGGAQNAHTWDTVALALGRPTVALDLPGHGHSDHRPDHDYAPLEIVDDVASALEQLAPLARAVVGMSLGGLTTIALAARHPHLVRRLGVVDVSPGVDRAKSAPIRAFIDGPETFPDFEAILGRTIEHNPERSESSLRRGVLHNAVQLDDGTWRWRYDRKLPERRVDDMIDHAELWDLLESVEVPLALWQGGKWSVMSDQDVDEWLRRRPGTVFEIVDGAGHSIQGDRPLELARLIEDLLDRHE